MAKALLPLAEGFEEIEALTIVDVLRRGGVEVVTAALDGVRTVVGAHAIPVTADAAFADVAGDEYDVIVLPGGGPGTDRLRKSEALLERLRRQKGEGRLLAAICAAPLVLVDAGVLDEGQCVTCYPTCQMDLDRPWSSQPVVDHDGVITGQAPGTAMLFSLVVLQALAGPAVTSRVARGLVTDAYQV